MLTTLRIKNLALVEDLVWDLAPGYNVVTGETGAGKSILIDALSLVLGERADRTLVRAGAEACMVEAVFEIGGNADRIAAVLDASGLEPCEGGQLMVKRVLSLAGSNRQFVNGSPATLQALQELGRWLVDIHGAHEHQSLLETRRQLELLDAFGGLQATVGEFTRRYRERAALRQEREQLLANAPGASPQQLEPLRLQIRELQAAKLDPAEEPRLEAEFDRASQGARLIELARDAAGLMDEHEASILPQLEALGRALRELERVDPSASTLKGAQEEVSNRARGLLASLSRYAEGIDLDPARLAAIEARVNQIRQLKRKYGRSVAGLVELGAEAAAQLERLEQLDTVARRLDAGLARMDAELERAASALSDQRCKAAVRLGKAVSRELHDLCFLQSRFDIELARAGASAGALAPGPELGPRGTDAVEFLFAPNPGEPARPLRAIASSGELARVMLALKQVLAAADDVPVLIFDEVDANVGGDAARAVGEKMGALGRHRQVLCVTHLAAVAACAGTHFVATKSASGSKRVTTQLRRIEGSERESELARMIGGHEPTARQHAAALLAAAERPADSQTA
jgi:DNA repair protein RecN (Recombination protein N)